MSDDRLHINGQPLKSNQQKIKLKDQVLHQNTPPKIHVDLAAPIKSVNPVMVLKTFGLSLLQTEIYRGRIPINPPEDESPVQRKSKLGTSIFSDLQFLPVGGEDHIPIDKCLFDVNLPMLIVRTAIQGKNGQTKEYIGEDDADVTIRGIVCGTNGAYPLEQVKNLLRFCRRGQSLGILSKYLNEVWDITEVVVKNILFEQPEGSQSFQKFEIQLWSDKPVEILIREAKA
jgi:hypothetical protein